MGEELALCFAEHGARLILSARNKERLEVWRTPKLSRLDSALAACAGYLNVLVHPIWHLDKCLGLDIFHQSSHMLTRTAGLCLCHGQCQRQLCASCGAWYNAEHRRVCAMMHSG